MALVRQSKQISYLIIQRICAFRIFQISKAPLLLAIAAHTDSELPRVVQAVTKDKASVKEK